jgi:hypothetical protein
MPVAKCLAFFSNKTILTLPEIFSLISLSTNWQNKLLPVKPIPTIAKVDVSTVDERVLYIEIKCADRIGSYK